MAESVIQRKITDPEYATQSFSATVTLAKQSSTPKSVSIDVTKSGYTPVGIVSVTNSNSGSGNGYFNEVTLVGNTASCKRGLYASWQDHPINEWQVGSAAVTVTITVKYIKNN